MNVFVSRPSGYCAAVIRAIELVKDVRQKHKEGPVFVLGSIVHNEDVINELTSLGITTIRDDKKSQNELLASLPDEAVVVFTAHGHAKELDAMAKKKMMTVYDATCPMVNLNHKIVKSEVENNHQIIYIGKKNHPEATAALSLSKNVFLLDDIDNFSFELITDKSPLVINQTTLSHLELKKMHSEIKARISGSRFADEICSATRFRQKAVLELPSGTQLIYVIGGEYSSNTQSLVEIARGHYPKARVVKILNESFINKKDLTGLDYVAIVSSASTPLATTQRVAELLKAL